MRDKSAPGAVYVMGFVGATIYYLQHSSTVWMGFVGIVKALFWPAFLILKAYSLLKM